MWSRVAFLAGAVAGLVGLSAAPPLLAQTDGTCIPQSERAGREFGCFIVAREELGSLPPASRLYWYVDAFPTVAAARAAKGATGTVVESFGRVWLFSIAEESFPATAGQRLARVGPLPLVKAQWYAAVYMEGVFKPGMASVVHRHPGVEAWVTIEGSMCLETPNGKLEQSAGGPGTMVEGGVPMQLTGTGTVTRRSLVLILQDADLPRSTPARDWSPRGLCTAQGGAAEPRDHG